jgi:O-antigen/teichoic acid export membrane protein
VVKLLDPVEFGQYAISLTMGLIFLYPVMESGTELLITRESAKGNTDLFFQSVYWKLGCGTIGGVFLIGIGSVVFKIPLEILILSTILICCRSLENGNAAHLRGIDLSRIESRHLIISRGTSLLLLVLTIFVFSSDLSIFLAIIYQIVGILFSIFFVEKIFILQSKPSRFSFSKLKAVLIEGFPLLLNSIAWLVYFKIDVLLLGLMLSETAAGTYEIAYKILEAVLIIPGAVMAIVLRLLVRADTKMDYLRIFSKSLVLLLLVGTAAAVTSYFVLPCLFPLVFQNHQTDAIGIYQVLAFSIPAIFVGHLTTQCLVIQDTRYTLLAVTLVGAALNLTLNFPLIHLYGAKGAASATVVTETVILFLSAFFVWRGFGKHIIEKRKIELR